MKLFQTLVITGVFVGGCFAQVSPVADQLFPAFRSALNTSLANSLAKFFGTAAPGSVTGNLPGDIFVDTTNHKAYICNAPSGTATPACTSVATAGWLLLGNAVTGNPLSQFAATTSAQLAGVVSDETGSGALVFGTAPTITLANGTGLPLSTGVSGTLQAAQEPAHTGDMTNSAGSLATTVVRLNGVSLAGLATGILKNTTTTGVPSIAVAADFPTLNQSTTGYASALKSATTTVDVSAATAPTVGQVLTATDSTHATWQTGTAAGMVTDQGPRQRTVATITGTNLYVSASGSGSACTSVSTPCTMTTAQSQAQGGANKHIYMLTGTYTSGAAGVVTTWNQNDHDEIWEAYPGNTPVMDGNSKTTYFVMQSVHDMQFLGITWNNLGANTGSATNSGIWFNGNGGSDPTNVTFKWNTFSNCLDNCIWAYIASGLVYSDNVCNGQSPANNGGGFNYACIVRAGIASMGGATITHNYFHDLQGTAILVTPGTNELIDRNIIKDVETSGASDMGAIYVQDTTGAVTGIQVTYNWIDGNAGSGLASSVKGIYYDSGAAAGPSNTTTTGNVILKCGQFCVQIHGGNHNAFTSNVFDVTQTGTDQLLFNQSAGGSGSTGGMIGNTFTSNIILSKAAFPSSLVLNNLNGSDAATAFSGNTFFSVTNAAIPTTPDLTPIYNPPTFELVKPIYLRNLAFLP